MRRTGEQTMAEARTRPAPAWAFAVLPLAPGRPRASNCLQNNSGRRCAWLCKAAAPSHRALGWAHPDEPTHDARHSGPLLHRPHSATQTARCFFLPTPPSAHVRRRTRYDLRMMLSATPWRVANWKPALHAPLSPAHLRLATSCTARRFFAHDPTSAAEGRSRSRSLLGTLRLTRSDLRPANAACSFLGCAR